MPVISSIKARQILDSRGNPTVEVDLWLEDGYMGRAAVPSGASTGSREALELRDGGTSYLGLGVSQAVNHVHDTIAPSVVNRDWQQSTLDQHMIELDGTPNKSKLGANAILGVSLAFAVAEAKFKHVPLFRHLADLSQTAQPSMPKPILNVMNGGAHADWSTDFQEYMLFPMGDLPFSEHLRKSVEVYHHLGQLIKDKGLSVHVGDEGGYAPALNSNEEAFELLMGAVKKAGYEFGEDRDFMIGVDVAATEFFDNGSYQLKRDKTTKSPEEMIDWMIHLSQTYPIYSLEDPLAESDWEGWQKLTTALKGKVQIVGDDLLATDPQYVQKALDQHNCNAMIIKVNQIGTLSQALESIRLASAADWRTIVSHRSGETEDTFIAHLAVGTDADQIKTGAPARSERTAKYNELLRIEEQLK